ncbi:hypothetical protein L1987_20172 [Smallanthus sonchifolius]|uniref:Uncharacterized protein n=1 Tax=Smallanthus sonchifolius TaxID=185202 RepID=A0ACB9ISB1_9ASTR|nr:hypothetical protein L1987_20172 [Smallanthus sonchifolius]
MASSYFLTICSSSSSSSSIPKFPSSIPFPSSLHRFESCGYNGISLPRTYAKFDKFEGQSSNDNFQDIRYASLQEQEEEEDDSCLPSDLEGAVRQSSEASAVFVSSWGMRAIVELLIPQLQFLDDEGAQGELWELSKIFVDTLIEETGCERVKAIFPDAGAAALLKYRWNDATFSFASDRKPVEKEDEIVVMILPDYQMLEYVERIACDLSNEPVFFDDKDRPNRYILAKEMISRPDSEDLEVIFGGGGDESEQGPSLFSQPAGIFKSLYRFMKVISK